ncbi:MAG: glycoside hydrolase family 3 C-terminal domain-containing protein [Saprospiraceae bacterium]|nr:glycoside hydrolase family 3 C-terminal domain-containing protein [Saprospiraceae bacterium]
MYKYLLGGLFLLGTLYACQSTDSSRADAQLDPAIEKSIDSLLRLMTLEEKIGQMNQYRGSRDFASPNPGRETLMILEAIKNGSVGSLLNVSGANVTRNVQEIAVNQSRLGIPLLFGYEVIHGYKTMFPMPLAQAASWDLEAIELSSRIGAIEAASAGVHWALGATVDIFRDARMGQVVESAGEDPYLSSLIAVARVKGLQGQDLRAKNTIAAAIKHLPEISYTQAGQNNSQVAVNEQVLENIIWPPLQGAVAAGAVALMSHPVKLIGKSAQESVQEQEKVLRDRLGFKGINLSGPNMIAGWVRKGVGKDRQQATEIAVNAGYDVDMGAAFVNEVASLVREGTVSKKKVDQAVRRVLRLKFQLGLFDDPYRYSNPAAEKQDLMHRDHIAAAHEIAKKSIVLLKNEGGLLPLSKETRTIAVIGPMARDRDTPLGSLRARARTNSGVPLLNGLRETVGSNTRLLYAQGCRLTVGKRGPNSELTFNESDRSGFPEAVAAAKQADVVVLALGEDCWQTGKAAVQENIGLAGLQEELLQAVYEANKNIVLVLMNGRPLTINWAADHIPAIVEAWQLGHMSGMAIADVLWGDYNPSGKLPISFPSDVAQCPIYYNHQEGDRQFFKTDQVVSGEARFPFGFGLSYTQFEYAKPMLSSPTMGMSDTLQLSISLTNVGEREGAEVVQLYLQDKVSSIARPVKELKGFRRIKLAPGTTEVVRFSITAKDLGFYGASKSWEAESGAFSLYIGTNSRDVQEATFELIAE